MKDEELALVSRVIRSVMDHQILLSNRADIHDLTRENSALFDRLKAHYAEYLRYNKDLLVLNAIESVSSYHKKVAHVRGIGRESNEAIDRLRDELFDQLVRVGK